MCGIRVRLANNMFEDLFVRLRHMQVVGSKDRVEIVPQPVLLPDRVPVQLVGIGEQDRSVSFLPQRCDIIQPLLRKRIQHTQPCGADLINRRARIAVFLQRSQKLSGRYISVLIVVHQLLRSGTHSHHSFALIVYTENITDILLRHQPFEITHTPRHIQIDDHAA